jgi:prolyl-tRNA editing enzyme YbaK/EbsC (Cys-tRNA(Pro) deacylase)
VFATSLSNSNLCHHPRNHLLPQYTARFHADKLKNYIHKLNQGRVGKQFFNMRLCDEAVSDDLSGFEHNAVSPIGIKTHMPWVISHEILKLEPDFFWLGAGEVDLKVGLPAAEFVDKYQPMVVDCTY